MLTLIAAACRDRERAALRLPGAATASRARREVEPHSLVNVGRRWYLVAWDCGREDWRTFRVDRLTRPHARRALRSRASCPAEDAAAFVAPEPVGAAQPLRGAAHPARLGGGDAQAHAALDLGGPFEPLGEERCEYRTGDDNLDWLAARIAMLGVEFEVHEPPELVEHLRALAARLGRAVPAA